MANRIAITLFACLVVLTAALMLSARHVPPPMLFSPDANLMPGQPFPDRQSFMCDWQHFEGNEEYCYKPDYSISIWYNRETREIEGASYDVYWQNMLIGNLLQTWGDPVGYSRNDSFTTIEWSNPERIAWLFDHTFSPNSRVGMVSFGPSGYKFKPWRGFTQIPTG